MFEIGDTVVCIFEDLKRSRSALTYHKSYNIIYVNSYDCLLVSDNNVLTRYKNEWFISFDEHRRNKILKIKNRCKTVIK